MDEYPKFLDPQTLAKLKGLELRARTVVEGYFSGLHKSPYHGFSIEFAEHREYAPGDDLRYVDWKVFGKTDKFYLKQYEQETNLIEGEYRKADGIAPFEVRYSSLKEREKEFRELKSIRYVPIAPEYLRQGIEEGLYTPIEARSLIANTTPVEKAGKGKEAPPPGPVKQESKLLVEVIAKSMLEGQSVPPPEGFDDDDKTKLVRRLRQAAREANSQIFREARANLARSGMGTTCTAVHLMEKYAVVAQVGGAGGLGASGPVAISPQMLEDGVKRARTGQGGEVDGGFSFRSKIDVWSSQVNREFRPAALLDHVPKTTKILWIPAEKDELIPPRGVQAASKAFKGTSQIVEVPYLTHFQIYSFTGFEVSSNLAADWFLKYLGARETE